MKKIYFLIRCTKNTHKNCTDMMNCIMEQSKNVLQSYTTNLNMNGTSYCVTSKALVKNSEVGEFTDSLNKMQTESVGVDKLKVLISQ